MRLSSLPFVLAILLAFVPVVRAQGVSQPTAELITIGPGDALWEKYGHNMLRIRVPDPNGRETIDVTYHWGVFNFDQPNFVGNFVLGRMTYGMGRAYTPDSLEEYRLADRHIVIQRLNLSSQQVIDLLRLCEQNYRPENRLYRYDYFRDNCATRVRDMIDRVSGGALRQEAESRQVTHPGLSFRQHAVRLMQDNWLAMIGIDFAIGPATDEPLSTWDACFVPMEMVPVVAPMSVESLAPWTTTRPAPYDHVPRRWPALTAIGVVAAAGIAALARSRWRRLTIAALATWWLVSLVGAGFMIFVWGFTDHWSAYRNHNLLHFSPLALAAMVGLLLLRRRPAWLRWSAAAIVGVAVVGALLKGVGVLTQDNVAFIGLSLPLNLASLYAAVRLTRPHGTAELAGTPS